MSWRQLRTSVLVVGGALAVIAAILAVTGVQMNHLYTDYRDCSGVTCNSAFTRLLTRYPRIDLIELLVIAAPAAAGIFWGGPLVSRELESGTFRLAWTQGVSRTRWIVVKLAVGAAVSAVAVGILTFAMTWWAIPLDRVNADRIDPMTFTERGVVPVAYALCAFALGVAASAVVRRTLGALATTLTGFIAVRVLTQLYVRPRLVSPLHKILPLTSQLGVGISRSFGGAFSVNLAGKPSVHAAWVTDAKIVDAAGNSPTSADVQAACQALINQTPPPAADRATGPGPVHKQVTPQIQHDFASCLHNLGLRFHEAVTYQPESRFWELQWLESLVFLGLAAVLVGLTVYWVRRRLV